MPITLQTLAARLRTAREAAGLTQEVAARHLGLPRSSLAQVELGNRTVSGLELDALARLYGRSIEEFLAEEFHPEESLVAIFRAEASFADAGEVAKAVSDSIALARELANLDEGEVISAEARTEPGSQTVQLYDVVLLAHHFGVSRLGLLGALEGLQFVVPGEVIFVLKAGTLLEVTIDQPADRR
jgi:transcriptional regulator with XRE-family HTH domain